MSDYARKLAEANASIKTTNIKGKEYAEVPERVRVFWELFPDGDIVNEMLFDDGQRCVFKSAVYRDKTDDRPAATGHAFEVKQGMINSTSYVENCETSAIGRALGILGIGNSAIASAEEVRNAIRQQESRSKAASAPKTTKTASSEQDERTELYRDINKKKVLIITAGKRTEEQIRADYADRYGSGVGMQKLTIEELRELLAHLNDIIENG